ncbi:TetR/AcrR family transcriptional regulator [Frankia sp. QA3]|uniref:TetR/AcrR family transcriptional regulator n=1 Tax=Frankia sp. QA3 TaxID=710111 RepID=UPI000269C752|nr:TetR/AcrR family transcriptional regulator [Frankia sp. QA3]EIV94858.1 transcriptional regulator [Frankia sp. QA3]
MSIQQRRERELAQRRRIIISTTRKLAESEGWSAVTTRRLADEIEYSQPVLYQHFHGRDEIIKAVALEGFGELTLALREVRQRPLAPEAKVSALAQAFMDFAAANPRLYEAMFTMSIDLLFGHPDSPSPLISAFAELREGLSPVVGSRDLDTLTEVFWASLHGLVILTHSGRLRPTHQQERLALCVQQITNETSHASS